MGRKPAKGPGDIIERRKRQVQIEKLLLAGFTNQIELAARFGVSQPTISLDIKAISQAWAEYGPNNQKERRSLRVKQLEKVMQVATDSFVRSQESEVEDSTTVREIVCPVCGGIGEGKKGNGKCRKCKGEGVLSEETTKHSVKGTAGDSSFLRTIVECIKEINKLEGNHKPKDIKVKTTVEGAVLHAHLGKDAGAYANVDSDVLISARVALEGLKQAVRLSSSDIPEAIEGRVMDGKVVDKNGDIKRE